MSSSHLFIASDGDLFDTRVADWSKHPLRPRYRFTCAEIKTVTDFKATVRNGGFAWPGGYPLYMITSDGGALCFGCAKQEARNIMPAIANRQSDGWRVVHCDINYEDADLTCDHCSKPIESAYGDD